MITVLFKYFSSILNNLRQEILADSVRFNDENNPNQENDSIFVGEHFQWTLEFSHNTESWPHWQFVQVLGIN